jgi:hypothetical protein
MLRNDAARLKVKSFALLTVKSSASPQVKSDADASDEIKSVLNPPKADFTRAERGFHHEVISPVRRTDLVEKSKSNDLLFSSHGVAY